MRPHQGKRWYILSGDQKCWRRRGRIQELEEGRRGFLAGARKG